MDFRIISIAGFALVLLERFQNDDQWQVFISVFLDEQTRYDEWIDCETAGQAKDFIKTYPEVSAHEFMQRALDWFDNEPRRQEENDMFIDHIKKQFRQSNRIASA